MYPFTVEEILELLRLFKVQFVDPKTGNCTESPCPN